MKKLVNGIEIEMSEEEIFQFSQNRIFIEPIIIPSTITRMQLITALSKMGLITPQEAVEANFVVPAGVLEVINNLPEEQRVPAEIKWLNFTEAYRNDELVLALGAANNMSPEDIDNFFIMAGSI